jgi:hypothetical protein
MMEKVVLRYRDGRTERATIEPIDVTRSTVIVQQDDGPSSDIPFSDLKAIFFPRAPVDDSELEPAAGMQIAVEFNDGEVIRGAAQYNPERTGFFLFPHDRSKNERIFVVSSAIVSIEVEKL